MLLVFRQSASHRTALLLHVPAPLHGVPYHTDLLMQRRGHLGGYCPVHLTSSTTGSTTGSESRLTATGHGTCHQRAYGCVYHGRVYSCSSLAALNAFARSPEVYLDDTRLPSDLPLLVPLGAQLRTHAPPLSFGGYCPGKLR